ncbi:helix-turn-helix domain-containing protein [Geodermatophilus sp. CPCC 206100]|uniref:helix-turn-helix domain-containing protein n=1 Tax=Geodermatophilus sp. CPCC 206100 TaxID=3020054 RepID=UPI003AFFB183
MPEGPEPVGPLLRRLRLADDLTLEGLSALSGVSDRALSDIERGVARGPQHQTVLAVARALRLSAADRAALGAAARAGRRLPRAPALLPLPADLPDFTGRARELARLTAALSGPPGSTVVVTGPPGQGKTALAVRAASLLRAAFPDQLFLDLGGTTGHPPSADAVATRVLPALTGRDGGPGRAGDRLRRVLAERPVLLVLDDAAAESQVRALRPAGGPGVVLVTSRRSLAGLEGVQRVALDRLPAADAERLLAAIVPPGQAAAADLARLARLCDSVPLALRVAGNRVASRPGSTAAGLVARLAVRAHRLDALTAGDLRVRAAIGSSVDQLGAAARQLFGRLALVEGPTFSAERAAALVGEPRWRAEELLDELTDLNLVQPAAGDRYALGGLLRLSAEAELATHQAERVGDAERLSTASAPGGPGARPDVGRRLSRHPPARPGRLPAPRRPAARR